MATLTVYPDPNVETTTVDGYVARLGVNETWATIRAGAGNNSSDSLGSGTLASIAASSSANQFAQIIRSIFLFDTSSIDDTATISAATLSIYPTLIVDNFNLDLSIVTSTPASNTALINSDYAQLGTTKQATDIDITGMSTGTYTNISLNATGIASINKAGVTKLGARIANDADNSAPSWSSGFITSINFNMADTTGTTSDPKLVVTYSTSTFKPNAILI